MTTMVCSVCHRAGIYWANLSGPSSYTICPWCGGTNCQQVEEDVEPDYFDEGYQAYLEGLSLFDCPYEGDAETEWESGWISAEEGDSPPL